MKWTNRIVSLKRIMILNWYLVILMGKNNINTFIFLNGITVNWPQVSSNWRRVCQMFFIINMNLIIHEQSVLIMNQTKLLNAYYIIHYLVWTFKMDLVFKKKPYKLGNFLRYLFLYIEILWFIKWMILIEIQEWTSILLVFMR